MEGPRVNSWHQSGPLVYNLRVRCLSHRRLTRPGAGPPPGSRLAPLLLAAVCAPACGDDEGFVEMNWMFLDTNLDGLTYPDGDRDDTCDLTGVDGDGQPVDFSLSVRLTIERSNCVADCIVREETFGCERLRGTITDVPDSGGEPYTMRARAIVSPGDGSPPFVPVESCVAGPGPRYRNMAAGQTVDLQVMQFIAYGYDASATPERDGYLDLAACRPP